MLSEWWSRLKAKSGEHNLPGRESADVVMEPPWIDPDPFAVTPVHSPVAAQPERSDRGISFAVDGVEPATRPLWSETLEASLARRFQRGIVMLPGEDRAVVNSVWDELPENVRSKSDVRNCGSRLHPLIEAVHLAFSQHRPLTISPDSIWLTIAQGFGRHVNANAEMLRGRLVAHEGQRELTTPVPDLSPVNLENAVGDLCAQIRAASDPVIHDTLVCDFSTTTKSIRTASEIAILDAYSSYFKYVFMCVCGIPRVMLEGTLEDWRRIRDRVEVLATFDLEWWVARLRPILDELVTTADGHPTPEFWQAIYKPKKAYASTLATGWITDLFPYLGDTDRRERNPTLQKQRTGWALPVDSGVGLKRFPPGLSSVPVTTVLPDGRQQSMDLVGGFFGVIQDSQTLAVSPLIDWSLTEPAPREPIAILQ